MHNDLLLHCYRITPVPGLLLQTNAQADLEDPTLPYPLLIPIPGRVILRADHQTPPFLRSTIDCLNDIDKLLLVLQHPVQLVVVTCTKIAHHVLVTEEEHDGTRVIKLIHGFEIGHLVQVAEIDDLATISLCLCSEGKRATRGCEMQVRRGTLGVPGCPGAGENRIFHLQRSF